MNIHVLYHSNDLTKVIKLRGFSSATNCYIYLTTIFLECYNKNPYTMVRAIHK
jgi:hypothetical protein